MRYRLNQINFIKLISILPETFDIKFLSKALGISRSKVYNLIIQHRVPYYKLTRKIIIFKENFIEWVREKSITPFMKLKLIKDLPNLFSPLLLKDIFKISKSKVYLVVKQYNLNIPIPGKKIIVSKEELVNKFLNLIYY